MSRSNGGFDAAASPTRGEPARQLAQSANPFPFHSGPTQPSAPTRPAPQNQTRPNYADELTDWGVPPQDEMQPNVGSQTPTTIPGGHVVTTDDMRKIVGSDMLLFDVLGGDPHQTLPGAAWLPGLGDGDGSFDDALQAKLAKFLSQVTNGDTARPMVFFCEGAQCWESYNAALRAVHLGYSRVLWYRGGLASWQAAGQPLKDPINGGNRSQERSNSGQ